MNTRTWIRRAAAASAAMVAVLALGVTPVHADSPSCSSLAANVIRTPQSAFVLADGESGAKRPV
ncbi:hypothetical protein [Nonomuraea sp. NPDC050643]|uniref:hypothetical protein n=1 Tax=Nonomuraea sp. NPDC050643 TaxID=3155660 RepID=UPI0033FE7C61